MRLATVIIATSQMRLIGAVTMGLLVLPPQVFASDDDLTKIESKLPPAAKTDVDFTKDIQPLFENHCYSCHGTKKQESGLRLDDADMALKGGDLGLAYVPGKSA